MLNTIMTHGAPGEHRVISSHDWLGLLDQRARLRRQWHALFQEFDFVLTPPFGTFAFEHMDEADWSKRILVIDGAPTPYGDQLAWPGIASFAGLPASIAPIGKNPGGLPMGVQIIGAYLKDRTTIAVAGWIEALCRRK